MRRVLPIALVVIVLFVLVVALQCLGLWVPGIDVAFYLAFGWIAFLRRVGPQLTVRWDLIGSTAVYAAALAVGAHVFLRWLYREWNGGGATADARWQWRWTLGGLAIVLVMFAAGTAAVGIAHQTSWLVRSPEPLYRRGSPSRAKVVCMRNLRRIGQEIDAYARAHAGRYPDDLAALLDEELEPQALICPGPPAAPEDVAPTARQAKLDLAKPGYLSYYYFGKGLTHPTGADRVIAVESLENHDGSGVNVLYGDGEVRWRNRPEAEALLTKLGFERVDVR